MNNNKEGSYKEKEALLFGILLGDGCLSHYYSKEKREYCMLVITGNLEEDSPFFKRIIRPLIHSLTDKEPTIKERRKYGAIEIAMYNKTLFERYQTLGFSVGKKKDIIIPLELRDKIEYIIEGLFATDGSLTIVNNNETKYPRMFITAALPSALKEIQKFLQEKEIKCSLYTAKRQKEHPQAFKRKKEQWVLCVNGRREIEKVREIMRFINPKQENRWQEYVKMAVPRIELGISAL